MPQVTVTPTNMKIVVSNVTRAVAISDTHLSLEDSLCVPVTLKSVTQQSWRVTATQVHYAYEKTTFNRS